MEKYRLFGEWREIEVIGDGLGDALMRRGKIQRPDKYAEGKKIHDGEILSPIRIISGALPNYSRGDDRVRMIGDKPEGNLRRVVLECSDKQIIEVDAKIVEIF